MATYKHILCPSDFTACSDEAALQACEMASEAGAKLTLLHVVGHFPQDRSNDEIAPENQDPVSYRKEKSMQDLAQQAKRVGCPDAELDVTFTSHACAYGIISYASTSGVDLIVMATHQQDWLSGVFGDTTKYVQRKADCDVMVVPTD